MGFVRRQVAERNFVTTTRVRACEAMGNSLPHRQPDFTVRRETDGACRLERMNFYMKKKAGCVRIHSDDGLRIKEERTYPRPDDVDGSLN
jgi:hypothetical protein